MDFSTVCRLCLSEDSLNSIFTSNEAEDKRHSTAIFLISGIKVSENDGLPQQMCTLCISYLNESLNYRKRCKEVENKLLQQSLHIEAHVPTAFEDFYEEPNNTVKTEEVKLKIYKIETLKDEIKPDVNFDVKDEVLDEKAGDDEENASDDEERDGQEKATEYTIDEDSNDSNNSCNNIVLYIGNNDDDFNQDVKKEIEVTTTDEIPVKRKKKHLEMDDEQDEDLPYEIDMEAPDRVVCKVCRKSLSIRSIDAHISSLHPGKDSRKMQCEICSVFILRHKHTRHMKMMHGIGPEMKTFRCSYCKSELPDKDLLVAHVASCVKRTKKREPSKSSKQLQECDVCHKVMQKGSLRLHKAMTHAGLRPVCEHCGGSFGNKYRLQEHYRAKHGYEKFKCGHCDFETASAMALRNHERRHRGEKPFVCETCGAKFHAAYLLAQHKQSHRTERLAKCDLCPATFKARNSLHMHKLSVHSARVYACSLCTRVYSSRHYATRHLRRRHRGDAAHLTALTDDMTNANDSKT